MSLVKDAIRSLVQKGKIEDEITIHGIKFEFSVISTEEQILADGLVDTDTLKKKYGADNISTFRDTIEKYRSIAQIAFAIKRVNGAPAVDENATFEERFKQRVELRNEIAELDVTTLDALITKYRQLIAKQREFLKDIHENVGKS